jgi:hypothetical protein
MTSWKLIEEMKIYQDSHLKAIKIHCEFLHEKLSNRDSLLIHHWVAGWSQKMNTRNSLRETAATNLPDFWPD